MGRCRLILARAARAARTTRTACPGRRAADHDRGTFEPPFLEAEPSLLGMRQNFVAIAQVPAGG